MRTTIPEDINVGTAPFRELQKYAKKLRKAVHLLVEEFGQLEEEALRSKEAKLKLEVELAEAKEALGRAGAADEGALVYPGELKELISHVATAMSGSEHDAVAGMLAAHAVSARARGRDSVANLAKRGAVRLQMGSHKL